MSKVIEIKMVDHLDVNEVKKSLAIELTSASITRQGTYRDIEKAKSHLERARGMYLALKILDLMSARYAEDVEYDLDRITDKLETLQREKMAESVFRNLIRDKS